MTTQTALIPILEDTLNNETTKTVNARDLHQFLEVKTRFNDWIARRIKEFEFIEGIDFIVLNFEYGKEYHTTLDMAKELSMVERNEKGREARRYFIQCEKELHNPQKAIHQPSDMIEAAKEAKAVAEIMGFEGNQKLMSMDKYIHAKTGESPLKLMGQTEFISESKEKLLTPTEIGKEINLNAVKVNLKLQEIGLQTKVDKHWVLTEVGKPYAELLDTGKKHATDGTPVQQIKWKQSVVDLLGK